MAMKLCIPLPNESFVESHSEPKKHGHEADGPFSPHFLHERDQGEECLQRDLPLQHVADNKLQASESFVRQVASKVQRPQIATHACLALAPSQHVPHVSDRHRLKLMLRHRALFLKEPKGFSHILGVALSVDLPL